MAYFSYDMIQTALSKIGNLWNRTEVKEQSSLHQAARNALLAKLDMEQAMFDYEMLNARCKREQVKQKLRLQIAQLEAETKNPDEILSLYKSIQASKPKIKKGTKSQPKNSIKFKKDKRETIKTVRKSESDDCSICFERKKDSVLECGHLYCLQCITGVKQLNGTCPICQIAFDKIIQIYPS